MTCHLVWCNLINQLINFEVSHFNSTLQPLKIKLPSYLNVINHTPSCSPSRVWCWSLPRDSWHQYNKSANTWTFNRCAPTRHAKGRWIWAWSFAVDRVTLLIHLMQPYSLQVVLLTICATTKKNIEVEGGNLTRNSIFDAAEAWNWDMFWNNRKSQYEIWNIPQEL